MKLEELQVYQLTMELGEKVWKIVLHWEPFARETIGKQLVKSTDSVAANLSEGFGRFHFKESKQFGYYSRGSLYESKTGLTKAYQRNLITQEEFEAFSQDIKNIGVK